MVNSELKEKVKEIIESDKRIVICDFDRGIGKTTASLIIANKLVSKGNTVTILYGNKNMLKCAIYNSVSSCGSAIDKRIILKTVDKIKDLKPTDYIIFDDVYDVYNKEEIENYSKMCGKIIVFSTFKYNKDIDIIRYSKDDLLNSYKPSKEILLEDFKKQEIQKLMKEFSEIPNIENTTMTRERILNMINTIKDM